MNTPNKNQYIPGVCNIGPDEIQKRKRAGWLGLGLAVALWGFLTWVAAPAVWQLTLFVPAMISATGFLQAYMHFCAYFGFASLFNFGDVGTTDSVSQAEFRAQDRRKAWQIIIYAALIGMAVALVGVALRLADI